jgi:tetratricopeptide (TPR) repeat protein
VAAGSAAAVALAATAAVAVVQGLQAREQAQRAQASRDFLVGLFERANPDLRGGRDATARELLEQGEADLARLPAEQRREVMQTTARLWVSFGDVARARQAQAAVSELLPAKGWPRVASRLEESRLAMLGWHTDEAERLLRAAEQAAPSALLARWPADLRARAAEQQGWVLYQRDRPAEAEAHFVAAREAARGLGSREGFALYGLAESQVEAGRWRAASKTLQEIQQFLESGDGARLSQREQHELLAALTSGFFKTGRYVDGWKFAQQLVERTEVFYGGGVEQQWQYRLPWLRTALRLKRADAVVAWLNAQPVGPLAGVDPAYEIEWQTTVARVHAGLGDAERSRRAIARARALLLTLPKEDPVGWPVFVDLAEAGAALALNDPARAARVLHEAVQAPATPARLQPLIDELAAVAAYRAGRPEEAERLLGRAFAARRAQSDLPHPDELVIRINMALLSLRPGAPASDLKGLSALLSEAAPILASAYGDLHPLAQLTSRLHEVLASPEARPSSAVMAYLQSVTGSYLDQLVL